jgi:hypothetical protein
MLEKNNIEAFLRVNGIAPTAKDEEIRSVLLSARWNNDEVDTALMVLKENIKDQTTHVDTLHKVFNSDRRLSASEINSLLGINVTISSNEVTSPLIAYHKRNDTINFFIALLLSVTISLTSIGYLMFKEKAGFFAPVHVAHTRTSSQK